MARCALDVSHPKFAKLCGTNPDLLEGLTVLRNNLAKDHKLCGWVNHPMPGFTKYQNKIWKYDCRPETGDQSSTRKGWRLYAYVPDPKAKEPIPAIAFFLYDKAYGSVGNHSTWIAGILKKFLSEESPIAAEAGSDRFKHQLQPDGLTRSLCLTCFDSVAVTADQDELAGAQAAHECGKPN